MICRLVFAAGAFAVAFGASGLSRAEEQRAAPQGATIPAPETGAVKPASEPQPPAASAPAPVTASPADATAKPASEPQPQSATPPAPEAVAAKPASEPRSPPANAVAQAPATPEAEAVRKALSALRRRQNGRGTQRTRGAFGVLRSARLRPALAGPAGCARRPCKRGLRRDRARLRVGARCPRFPLAFRGCDTPEGARSRRHA